MCDTNHFNPPQRDTTLDRKKAIRRWADRHSAVPVRGTSDGTLALVHEYKIDDRHERLDWETF